MNIEQALSDEVLALKIWGNIGVGEAFELRKALWPMLEMEGVRSWEFDLEECPRIDSSGFAVLVECFKKCGDRGISFRLKNPRHAVRQVLSITKLDQVLMG